MKYCVGIDLGGTNIAVGVVNENYEIVARAQAKTNCPRPAEDILADMAVTARKAVEEAGLTMEDVEWVGVGTPGSVNQDTGDIIYSNNLDFHDVPMRRILGEALGVPVYVENDANAAAYGEFVAGAAQGVRNALMITLGTGVGGGIIIDNKIYSGTNHAAGELGHMVVEKGGWQCTCGRRGCIEAYASATGLIRMTKEAMEADRSSKLWEIAGSLDKVDGKTAFDGMRAGDAAGKAVVDKYISYLGTGLANYVNIFQPEILVIGGGICKEGETLLAPLRDILNQETYMVKEEGKCRLMKAQLGNDAGIIGAAFLGKTLG